MITPEVLMIDNRGSKAVGMLRDWETAKDNEELDAVWICCDSRLLTPPNVVEIDTISAGGSRSSYNPVLNDPRIETHVVVLHHDGDEAVPGRSPGGCGGRDAKEKMGDRVITEDDGVESYVLKDIWHHDLVKQGYTAGAFTAFRSGKPTLVVTQDNLNLVMYPLFVFMDHGNDLISGVPLHYLSAEQYFPDKIYENGIPVLPNSKIPEIFEEFLQENLRQSSEIARKYRNLRSMQKTQNPNLLVVSTDIRPMTVRYPETTEMPGSVFRISVPQVTIDGAVRIKEDHIVTAIKQVNYPVAHFSNLDTILIETKDIERSASLAKTLVGYRWMKNWLSNPDHQILIAQVRRGETLFIEKMK